jgi:hypothetical protein
MVMEQRVSSTGESNYSLAYLDIFTSNSSGDTPISIVNVMNYANATTYKTLLNRNSHTEKGVSATVSLWRNTAAITSIYLANAQAATLTLAAHSISTASRQHKGKLNGKYIYFN